MAYGTDEYNPDDPQLDVMEDEIIDTLFDGEPMPVDEFIELNGGF
jgi:hypothetical protein